jgi:transcriptional regulator with XRE-family HTH domain
VKTNASGGITPAPQTSFRLRLQHELAQRCADNPQYSLRAFAQRLGTDHSTLSQLLRGTRPLTAAMIRRLGAGLGLATGEVEHYVVRAAADHAPPAADDVQRLTRDTAEAIAGGHHYAILELLRLDAFRPDSRWIARVLDSSVDEVNVALQRLIRLGLLEMRGPAEWVDTLGDSIATFADFSRCAVQRLGEHVRRLTAPRACREHSATTLAVDSASLPEAIARVVRFRRDLLEFLEQRPRRDDVYVLEIHLFPVTRIQQEPQQP